MNKGIENIKGLIVALLTVVDILDDIMSDGVSLADLPQLTRLMPIVDDFRNTPEVVEELKDLDEDEQAELLEFVRAEVEAANSDLEEDKVGEVAGKILEVAVHLASIFNIFKR